MIYPDGLFCKVNAKHYFLSGAAAAVTRRRVDDHLMVITWFALLAVCAEGGRAGCNFGGRRPESSASIEGPSKPQARERDANRTVAPHEHDER